MKVLHISTTDTYGGGAIAVNRIHKGLRKIGVDSRMLVSIKFSKDNFIYSKLRFFGYMYTGISLFFDRLRLLKYRDRNKTVVWSNNIYNFSLTSRINAINPDIVQLGWVGGGFFPISDISKISKPIIWRLSDMWAFTGGCHYSGSCIKYQKKCGSCPILKSNYDGDISFSNLVLKKEQFRRKKVTFVAISSWLSSCVKKSAIGNYVSVVVINNGIDTDEFAPIDKEIAKKILGITTNKQIILFGAVNAITDPRKGFLYLKKSLSKISNKDYALVIFGVEPKYDFTDFLGFETIIFSKISNNKNLVQIYSCADVMVVPSIEEAFGQTSLEALSCETPVVCFGNTGLTDMIDHKKNGYIARFLDSEDLSKGIKYILNHINPEILRTNARKKVINNFDEQIIAKKYKLLYKEILKNETINNNSKL